MDSGGPPRVKDDVDESPLDGPDLRGAWYGRTTVSERPGTTVRDAAAS